MILISDQLHRAKLMALLKHDHTTVIFENFLVINMMNISGVRHISWIDCFRKVDGHKAMRLFIHIVAEQLIQRVAARLIYIV